MTIKTLTRVAPFNPTWVDGLLLGLLSFVVTVYCLELIKTTGQISPLWCSTALMTIVIFRNPRHQLPLLLLGTLLGIICANTLVLGTSPYNLKFPLVNLVQAMAGGMLLRRLLDRDAPLNSLFSWCKMMLTVGLFTPLLGGLLASWLSNVEGNFSLHFFTTWTLSEAIGMLAFGPVCMLWQRDYVRRHLRQNVLFETLLTLMVTLILCWFSLRYIPWPFTAVVLILFYSAVRLPRFEAFVIYMATISMMSLMLALKLIPGDTSHFQALESMPWIPFLLALIPSHMMTLVMHSFREERKNISESETRFRHAMEYSAIGMALVSVKGQWLQANKSLCRLLGYTPAELYALTFQDITPPEDLPADLANVKTLLAGEVESCSMQKRYFRKDGQILWALLTVSLVRDSEQVPLYFISQIEDISDLIKTEKVNQRLMERITLANEAGGIGVWEWDLQSGVMSWDKRMFQIYRLPTNSHASYQNWVDSLHSADRSAAVRAFEDAIKTTLPVDIEFRIETDIGIRHIRAQCSVVLDEKGEVERMLGINQDITPLRQLTDALHEEKERMHITLDAIDEAVISTDEEMRVIFMNPVAEKMSGWLQHQASGRPISEILRITQGSNGPARENLMLCDLPLQKNPGEMDTELVLHNRAGEQFAIHYSLSPLKKLTGENIGSVMVIQDVSESREMLKRLSYSASHDMLTRLPNRVSFEHQLKRLILSCTAQKQHVLVFIDLDRFKAVNDTAGHAAGDSLLREISGVMQRHLRAGDFLARLGGDEFGVLLAECSLSQASEAIRRIVQAVNEYDFLWENRTHHVGASAGLTQISPENSSASELMAQADLACYNAKHNGRGQLSTYESHLLKRLKPVMNRIENEQIIAQQPMLLQVWAAAPPGRTLASSFYLAEMQLFTPEGHEIDEVSFRTGLHDSDLFVALDRKLIREFFQNYAQGTISRGLTLALPLSGFGLRDSTFINDTLAEFTRYNVPPDAIWFAINADVLSQCDEILHQNISRLRAAGSRIVLRDFGLNLDAFNQLPADEIDYLILASELVANVHCNLMDEMMVSIIHGHAQRLGINTLAGPVKLPVALDTLSTIGINTVWGDVIAPRQPLSALLTDSHFAIK
ncbi:diguanylate cyclase [Erwinia sorbitola]|uniref:diguanylate cyclase n=1 Tax=Erwinia sorbitola TaxID=2681984 RepID=A0A6I6ER28_9GAMM|nr:diguanylate cyclase [Erwinia sorbitola]QGU86992.1 diguanylate cyclase [Erwinia sorbitola]